MYTKIGLCVLLILTLLSILYACIGKQNKDNTGIRVDASKPEIDVYKRQPVNSHLSEGCNQLIRQGAGVLLSPEMLLEEMGVQMLSESKNLYKNEKTLESPENMVYSCVGLYPKSISRLVEETKLGSEELLQILVSLELQGFIREISKNYYIKIK